MMLPNNVKKDNGEKKDNKDVPVKDHTKDLIQEVNENDLSSFIITPNNIGKYVARIEKIVRSSSEYRQYIGILKSEMDMTNCKFIPEVDISSGKKVGMEMHHYPYSLYDIVSMRVDKIKEEENDYNSYNAWRVAEDVMRYHYEGKVGIVPLSLTAHELAHSGHIFIPLTPDYVFGEWESLSEDLQVSDEFSQKLKLLQDATESFIKGEKSTDDGILDPAKVVIRMNEASKPTNIEREVPEEDTVK